MVDIAVQVLVGLGAPPPKSSAQTSSVWLCLIYSRVTFQSFGEGELMGLVLSQPNPMLVREAKRVTNCRRLLRWYGKEATVSSRAC